jgi:hypothetical protein
VSAIASLDKLLKAAVPTTEFRGSALALAGPVKSHSTVTLTNWPGAVSERTISLSDLPASVFPPLCSIFLNDLEAGTYGVLSASKQGIIDSYFEQLWPETAPRGPKVSDGTTAVFALQPLIRSFCHTPEPLPFREGAMRTRLEKMLYTHRQELMHLARVGRILEHQKRLFFRRRLLLQTGQTGSSWIENRWDFARAWAFRASPPRALRSSDDTMPWLASQIAAGRGVRFAHFLAGRPALVITDAAVGSFVSVRRGELRNALAVAGPRFDANVACVALKQFLNCLRRAFADNAAPLMKLMRINGVLTAAFEHYQAAVRRPEPTYFPVFAALACFEANPQFLMSTLWYIREAFPDRTLTGIARTDGLVHTFETLCRQRQLAGYREMFRTKPKICLVDGELVDNFVRQATGIVGIIGTEWHVADAEWMLTTDRKRKVDAIVYGVKSQKQLANAKAFFKKVDPGNSVMKILLTNGPMAEPGEWKVAPNVWRALGILTGHLQ